MKYERDPFPGNVIPALQKIPRDNVQDQTDMSSVNILINPVTSLSIIRIISAWRPASLTRSLMSTY
jgi:hypothetical protein